MCYFKQRLAVLLTVLALAACSSGYGTSPTSLVPTPAHLAPATAVVVAVRQGAAGVAGATVEIYTGKKVDSCPPFGFPCVKKDKSLAKGTSGKNGQVTLNATFTSTQLVCAEAVKSGGWVQNCQQPFPTRVLLQFK